MIGWADAQWLHWFHRGPQIAAVGAGILVYNLALRVILSRVGRRRRTLVLFAWAQLLLDLLCLTMLSVWTGGLLSPVATFFVFHMVFASLLLPRRRQAVSRARSRTRLERFFRESRSKLSARRSLKSFERP